MERVLPIYNIHGTYFIVDVEKLQLRQRDHSENVISIFDMRDVGDGYVFEFDIETGNLPVLPGRVTELVKIPELVRLDPEGMALKYGVPLEEMKGKSDFDVMVDQAALKRRMDGHLPTILIAGNIFYVDLRMDMLRPHDDFLSRGIKFDEIDHYYDEARDGYLIPYNSTTHEFQELPHPVLAMPEHLILVSFPMPWKLDPIGYNRLHGLDISESLKEYNVLAQQEAQVVDWGETAIQELIAENKLKYPELATGLEQENNKGKRL